MIKFLQRIGSWHLKLQKINHFTPDNARNKTSEETTIKIKSYYV
jgi:hypothetical protein